MHFMNTWEIDDKADRFKNHPILRLATRLLAALRDLVDANSDGWAYWQAPVKSADKLMTLIENPDTATEADLKAAVKPIKSFCTRHKLTFPAQALESQ